MTNHLSRIALFYRTIGVGGAERVLVCLANSFIQLGLETDLVLCEASGLHSQHLWQISPKVRIVDLKAPSLLGTLPKLVRYLRQEQPLVLLTSIHYTNEIAILAKRLAGVSTRIVVSEQNNLSQITRHATQIKERLAPLAARCLYPLADGIVACSQGVAEDLSHITSIPLQRIQVIYNSVVTPDLIEKAKEPLDHPWFASEEPPVILGAGRLQTQKDFPTLIRAFAQVRNIRPARLVILGWGPDPERLHLETLVRELGLEDDVDLHGHVKNPFAYMARAAVFVLSSAWEGFGNVLVEAMALGTPIVSTNCESGPAEILDNGKYGLLTPVGDAKALAEGILKVLSDKPKDVEPAWLEQFTVKTMTQKYLDVLGVS